MSYERGWQAIHLEMPNRIPHTEYLRLFRISWGALSGRAVRVPYLGVERCLTARYGDDTSPLSIPTPRNPGDPYLHHRPFIMKVTG